MSIKTTKVAALACVLVPFWGCFQDTAERAEEIEQQEAHTQGSPSEVTEQAEDAGESLYMEARKKRMVYKGMKKSDVIEVLGWGYDEEFAPGMMREHVDKCMFYKLKNHPSVPPGEYLVAIGYDGKVYTAHHKLLLKAYD